MHGILAISDKYHSNFSQSNKKSPSVNNWSLFVNFDICSNMCISCSSIELNLVLYFVMALFPKVQIRSEIRLHEMDLLFLCNFLCYSVNIRLQVV